MATQIAAGNSRLENLRLGDGFGGVSGASLPVPRRAASRSLGEGRVARAAPHRPGQRQATFATTSLLGDVEAASAKRRALEELPSYDPARMDTQNRLHLKAEAATAKLKALADCLIAFELRNLAGKGCEQQRAR